MFDILIVCSLFYASALSALVERGEPLPNPSAKNFLRRAFHASVVLGNYLYIDGGDISQLVDGIQSTLPNNSTLSINLAASWTNKSVAINVIPKGSAPSLNVEALWKTPDAQSYYMWAGEVSAFSLDDPPPTELWKFTSNSSGGGTWSQIPVNSEIFSTSMRASVGSGVSIGDTGFYVGGIISDKTTTGSGEGSDATGVISFNYTSGIWELDNSLGLGTAGEILGAEAVTIPAFGLDGRGLMVVLGGSDPSNNPLQNWAAIYFPPMLLSNIKMYDPYIGLWTAQRATGDIPPPRELFCAVSVAGDNGTYEMSIQSFSY